MISPKTLPMIQSLEGCRFGEEWTVQSTEDGFSVFDDLPEHGLAIVGTRYPQRRSLDLVEKTISELRNTRLVIISGFAKGIDRHAHEMAIRYGLRTLAILGCGIDRDYPRENHDLRGKIVDNGGAILSQFPLGTAPLPKNFYERNGLISGLSKAVWVVEAAAVSGTLNTASWANRLNRDLYATPTFPGDAFYQGNEKLLSQRQTDRYPPAQPLFSAQSFEASWSRLLGPGRKTAPLTLVKPQTEIQEWVKTLESQHGVCHLQALLQHASLLGQSPGQFYLNFETEINQGYLRHWSDGRVEALI